MLTLFSINTSNKRPKSFRRMDQDAIFIDVGNSSLKGVQRTVQGDWDIVARCTWEEREQLAEQLQNTGSKSWWVGSVRVQWETELRTIAATCSAEPHFLKITDIPADQLDYRTPETLGIDRVLACLGAWSINQTDVLVVDAGTACTIDWMDAQGVYHGGVIAPGLPVIQAGFKYQTPALPSIPDRALPEDWPGRSTDDSMRWGILGSYREMIAGHLRHYLKRLDSTPEIWLTGGDADLVSELLNLDIQPNVHDFLVFEGMAYIKESGWIRPK
jgi:type III pantothenate kinase